MTAAVCSSDMLAIGVPALRMADVWLVAEDCPVVGMGRILAREQDARKTTTRREGEEGSAQRAAHELINAMDDRSRGQKRKLCHIQIEPELVVRHSTAAPRQNGGSRL